MTPQKSISLALIFTAIAAPSIAGGFAFDLPRLTFPVPTEPVTSQTCTTATTLGTETCPEK